MRVIVTTPHVAGPKRLVVDCGTARQCTDVAKTEMTQLVHKREGATVVIEAEGVAGIWIPLVEWVYRGHWAKELR